MMHLDKKCRKNVSLASCKLCDKIFPIDGGGISQVTSHSSRQLHLQREKAGQNQSTISLNPFCFLQLMAMENYSDKCSQI